MSRSKGSKNKPKVAAEMEQPAQPTISMTDVPVVPDVKRRSNKKAVANAHPEWVLTETMYGTPIAIVKILKNSKWCDLVVIPRYETKDYQTVISSTSVIKPDFTTEEIAKQYEGIRFYTKASITLNDIHEAVEEVPAAAPEKDTPNAGM